jgi:hypothetical protein
MYKLAEWIDLNKIKKSIIYKNISLNPHPMAMDYLEKHINEINTLVYYKGEIWKNISSNPFSYNILMTNKECIDFKGLCSNTNPIILKVLEQHIDNIKEINIAFNIVDWNILSMNESDYALQILLNNQDNIVWDMFCYNTNRKAVELLLENQDKIDWKIISQNTCPLIIEFITDNFYELYHLIDFEWLSANPSAVNLLEQHPEIIDWCFLTENKNAYQLIKNNMDKIDMRSIFANENKKVLELFTACIGKNKTSNFDYDYYVLSTNPYAFDTLIKYPQYICWNILHINKLSLNLIKNYETINPLIIKNNYNSICYEINWNNVLRCPDIFECNYKSMKCKLWIDTNIAEELAKNRFNPKYSHKWKHHWNHNI